MRARHEAELIEWLLHQGRECDDLGAILLGLGDRLVGMGLPVLRLSLSMPTVHPTSRALSFVWWRRRGVAADRIAFDPETEAMFRRSPLFYLREQRLLEARWKLDDPEVVGRFVLFGELREAGATEYALTVISFSERRTALEGVALSMATDRPGGFAASEIATVKAI